MALAEKRVLQLRIGLVEGLVAPVEPAAGLRDAGQERHEHACDQRAVLVRLRAGVGAGEDARRGLPLQLLERDSGVLARGEPFEALLDERAGERLVLVERRPTERRVLLEREPQLGALRELAVEVGERAQAERAQGLVEVLRARHAPGYSPGGPPPAWQPGHQYAIRLSSPCPRARIRVPQRRQRRPGRR